MLIDIKLLTIRLAHSKLSTLNWNDQYQIIKYFLLYTLNLITLPFFVDLASIIYTVNHLINYQSRHEYNTKKHPSGTTS